MWGYFSGVLVVQAAGWTLVHSLWQILLIWIAHRIVQRLLRNSTSSIRYAAAAVMLMLCAAIPAITFAGIWSGQWSVDPVSATTAIMPSGRYDLPAVPMEAWWTPWMDKIRVITPYLATAWFIGMAVQLIAAVRGMRKVFSLRSCATRLDLPHVWPRLLERIVPRTRATLMESSEVVIAATFGWLRPVVLLPIGLVTTLSPEQIESILAHELAHIRRRDFAVNMLQAVIESVLFFHPGIWIISRDIRVLREECCDDIAIEAIGGNRKVFAEALLAADGFVPTFAMSLAGGSLVDRVRRLLHQQRHAPARMYARCIGAVLASILSLAVVSDAAADTIGAQRQIARIGEQTLGDSVYQLLDAPTTPNPDLVPIITAAAASTKAGTLSRAQIIDCADVIARGGEHDALLKHSALRRSQWIKLSKRLFEQAKLESTYSTRRKLSYAALLLSAQDSDRPAPDVLQLFATDPAFFQIAALPRSTINRLQLIISICGERDGRAIRLFVNWRSSNPPGPVPDELRKLIPSCPFVTSLMNNKTTIGVLKE